MAGESSTRDETPFGTLVGVSKWVWRRRVFVWSTIITGILVSGFVAWLFADAATVPKLPIHWVYENPLWVLIIFLVVVFLFAFSGVISLLPVGVSERALRRQYLTRLSQDNELLTLSGVPAGLMARRVRLEDVFIPVQFRPIPPLESYPLTEEEIAACERRREQGTGVRQMNKLLIAEAEFARTIRKLDRVEIATVWEKLTRQEPAVVIQGYPGMGKSTFLTRLTLYMARRCLHARDATMLELNPVLLPLFVSLKEYADTRSKSSHELSLLDFIKLDVEKKFNQAGLGGFVEKWLNDCKCLVLLDGLDEVSAPEMRQAIQKAIRDFIAEQRHPEKQMATYNRFLITSRVAGYDLKAFPHYAHYFITELTAQQIEDFLPRWCRANIRRDLPQAEEEAVRREADEVAKRLIASVKSNQGVRELAENPLLLTLLATMQQKGIELPRRRAKLYKVVTETLLEDRNIGKGLPLLPEAVAVQRLGPLAFQMHGERNRFAYEEADVIASLVQAIGSPQGGGGSPAMVEEEARSYLKRISERGGLFVRRTGDFYGFFHRTFEEYFAARHMLKRIELERDTEIVNFVEMARRKDALWREPFLLAVAHKSGEDSSVASQLIRTLFHSPQTADIASKVRDLLLAATCIIESEPETIEPTLQREVADQLVQAYEQAQRDEHFDDCELIEGVTSRWLLSLPAESYEPALPLALQAAISDTAHAARQLATLTLLTMIGQKLIDCPAIVFDMLIPHLLALAGLPAVGTYRPATLLPVSPDFNVADLALAALSFLGKRGPTGFLLGDICQHFRAHPEQLRKLACYSLESHTLLTLTVVPLAEENYQRYESAIGKWIQLRDQHKTDPPTERETRDCISIHQTLLDCAEEVCYPANEHLLNMLQVATAAAGQSWQRSWQDYLTSQLKSDNYTSYQEVALLWTELFPEQHDRLASLILADYGNNGTSAQRYAQRFIAILAMDLRDLRYLRDLRDLRDLRYLRYLRYLSSLRKMLITRDVAERAKSTLPLAEPTLSEDLLTILLGRVLQIQEEGEKGDACEREVQQIAQAANDSFISAETNEVRKLALDVLLYLPARSANEITYVLKLAERATDERIQEACSNALEFASPSTPDAWMALEAGKQSGVDAIRVAVKRVLERRVDS